MKKYIAVILTLAMLLSTAACGATPPVDESPSIEPSNSTTPNPTPAPTEEQAIEVDKNLLTVEITVPADYFSEADTQESLDANAAEKGYKSVTLNPDGSVTYVMTKAQHNELMIEIRATIDDSLEDFVASGDYPTFVSIEANENYSAFDVVLSTDSVGLTEVFSVFVFYMLGGMYNAFNGTSVDNISVSFINQATGEVIETANSQDMAQ